MTNSHLVILKKPYLDMILDGRKRIELRLYKTRRPAFGRVWAGGEARVKDTGNGFGHGFTISPASMACNTARMLPRLWFTSSL